MAVGNVFNFLFGFILVSIIALILGLLFTIKITQLQGIKFKDLHKMKFWKYWKIYSISYFFALFLILGLLYLIIDLLPIQISPNDLFRVGLYNGILISLFTLYTYWQDYNYKKHQEKGLSNDKQWHFNTLFIRFLFIFIVATSFISTTLVIPNFVGLLSDYFELIWVIYISLLLIILFFLIDMPLKYKISSDSIEFYYLYRSPSEKPITENDIYTFKLVGLTHPNDFENAKVINNPRIVNLEEIYSYWIGEDVATRGISFFVMKNGDVVGTSQQGWDYRIRLLKALEASGENS